MNREIKFRVWYKSRKIMEYHYFAVMHGEHNLLLLSNLIKDDYELMEYTGLKDKNSKEIYEGDIVRDLDKDLGIIEFNNGSFIVKSKIVIPFWSVLELNGIVYPRTLQPNAFEIIGNIFENPELLSCPTCGGEGGVDSGGVTPWGAGINIPCPSCSKK